MKLLFGIVTCFLVANSAHSYNMGREITGGCPARHPFAVKNGSACCIFPECEFGNEVPCPTGNGCRSVERESCYLDGILIDTGPPTNDLRDRCKDTPRPDPDSTLRTVIEVFIGTGWYNRGGCSYYDGEFWGCISNTNSELEEMRENIDYGDPEVLEALKQEPRKQVIELVLY